jgi:glutamate/tyrosine decarboxylase-like PLP-dependent enzyme
MSFWYDPLNSSSFLGLFAGASAELDRAFADLPANPAAPLPFAAADVLAETAERLKENYPYAHPLYAGQMLKPAHPVARAAYVLAMGINPNNHALDGGRASSAMEIEAVAEIAAMFGLPRHLGHLTGGGTFANLEALWVAGQLERTADGRPCAIAASSQAHYTHSRISSVLGLPFVSIAVDERNRMDLGALERALDEGAIGTVVATLGTTGTGAVDPLDKILALRSRYNFRLHVDAAYGGYFRLLDTLGVEARAAYACIARADSIVIDPHKHGLQPYGCGCVLFADPEVRRLYHHDSPYTYFSSAELHLGEISLECSRAGAAAVALWATQRLFPLQTGGEFARGLEACTKAATGLYTRVAASPRFVAPAHPPQLDIAIWAVAAPTVEASSELAMAIFDEAARRDLHLATARLPVRLFPAETWRAAAAGETVVCLRSVLMKHEHLAWLDEIWARLQAAADAVCGRPPQAPAASPLPSRSHPSTEGINDPPKVSA